MKFHRFFPAEGAVHRAVPAVVGSVAALGILGGLLLSSGERRPPGTRQKGSLLVFCAASLKVPVEAAAADYEREFGVGVQLQFGGSQTLLANLELTRTGDLFLPADESYVEPARKKDLLRAVLALAGQQARIVVKKGHSPAIHSVADLVAGKVRLAQGNPEATAIGSLVRTRLREIHLWDAVSRQTAVFKGTVTDAATDVRLGAVDASFGWDSMAGQFPGLDFLAAPELAGVRAAVCVCLLSSAHDPGRAWHFARYLRANDRGARHFQAAGFESIPGDSLSGVTEVPPAPGSFVP